MTDIFSERLYGFSYFPTEAEERAYNADRATRARGPFNIFTGKKGSRVRALSTGTDLPFLFDGLSRRPVSYSDRPPRRVFVVLFLGTITPNDSHGIFKEAYLRAEIEEESRGLGRPTMGRNLPRQCETSKKRRGHRRQTRA